MDKRSRVIGTSTAGLRALIYTRVSTGRQADSGLGLTDQLSQATALCTMRGWTVIDHAQDEGISGKTMRKRPALQEAVRMLDAGEADVLVAAKLDRLSRSVKDFLTLMEQAKGNGWAIACLDLGLDTSTPVGGMVATILAAVAQHERALIAERTKGAHRVRRERGQRAGQLPILSNDLRYRIYREVIEEGRSMNGMARVLNDEGVATARNGQWYAATVRHVVRSVKGERELAENAAANATDNAEGEKVSA